MRIALTVLSVLLAAVSLVPAAGSFFLFDSPGSESSPWTQLLFAASLALPVFWLAGASLPWLFRTKAGMWFFALPLVDVAVIALAITAIGQFCGGMLACK